MKTISFEGICCAGKSSCIKKIEDKLPICYIQEYNDFEHKAPNPPQLSKELIWQAMIIFSKIERKRFQKWLKEKNNSNNEAILVDRSFITILAVQYATIPFGINNIMDELEEYWLNYPQVIVSDKIIILDVSHNEQLRRIGNKRENYLPIFLEKSFNLRFIDYIRTFCKKTGIPNIYVDTTNLSIDQIQKIALDQISLP